MMMLIRCLVTAAGVVLLLGVIPGVVVAADGPKTCVSTAVSARGEPSKFNWIARTKARGNWRAKVRAMTGLGDPYANWKRAENGKETCTFGAEGTVCEFTGIPCRKGS